MTGFRAFPTTVKFTTAPANVLPKPARDALMAASGADKSNMIEYKANLDATIARIRVQYPQFFNHTKE